MSTRKTLWPLASLGILLSAGCGGGVIQRADAPITASLPPATATSGFARIVCDPPEVDVFVDDELRGRLDGYPEGVMSLRRGTRRITLRKAGYYPAYAEINVGDTPAEISTRLIPEVPDP